MSKQIIYGDDARKALQRGIDSIADAVKTTLGPRGRNVVIEDIYGGYPIITKDGVTVAKHIDLKDPYENMGAMLCKQVSQKSNDTVGDGTTTATVLAQILVREGLRYVAAGGNPAAVKRGIEKAVDAVVGHIYETAQPVDSKEHITFVGTIAGNEEEVGALVAEAMEAVGKDGVITIEESPGRETILDITEGMQFERGYLSQKFVNVPERMEVTYENAYVLLCDHKIEQLTTILPFLEKMSRKPMIIMAEDIAPEPLAGIILNRIQGGQPWVAIKAPAFGQRRKDMLDDIAILTGGVVVSVENGITFENLEPDQLGQVRRLIVTKELTTLIEGAGSEEAIAGRIEELKTLLTTVESSFEKEKTQERLAKLSGGIAVIKVGASTEAELKEKKYRYEDALGAVRAAVDEGIVPGGGVTLLLIAELLDELEVEENDEKMGVKIVKRALEEPIRTIAENAGLSGDVVVNAVLQADPGFGLDARTGLYVDMIESGIIDPAKVTRTALQHAASIAALVLTTETLISEEPLPPGTQMIMQAGY